MIISQKLYVTLKNTYGLIIAIAYENKFKWGILKKKKKNLSL